MGVNFLISLGILLSVQIVIIIFIGFAFHLGYKEKLEQSIRFYIADNKRKLQEALDNIEQDYKDEVNDKRMYRKHIHKLLEEREELLEEREKYTDLIEKMRTQLIDMKTYKKLFYNIINK